MWWAVVGSSEEGWGMLVLLLPLALREALSDTYPPTNLSRNGIAPKLSHLVETRCI